MLASLRRHVVVISSPCHRNVVACHRGNVVAMSAPPLPIRPAMDPPVPTRRTYPMPSQKPGQPVFLWRSQGWRWELNFLGRGAAEVSGHSMLVLRTLHDTALPFPRPFLPEILFWPEARGGHILRTLRRARTASLPSSPLEESGVVVGN